MKIKVLQAGYPKSGNYWLYRNLKEVLLAGGVDFQNFIKDHPVYSYAKDWQLSYPEQVDINMIDIFYSSVFLRISSKFREKIEDIGNYAEQNTLVWTHSNYCSNSDMVFRHFNRVFYLMRDPRDVAISEARFAFTPYMQRYYPTYHQNSEDYLKYELLNIAYRWMRHVEGYLKQSGNGKLEFVFYENLKSDFYSELLHLANTMGISLSERQIAEIKNFTSVESMKKDSPGHVRKASIYSWQDQLDPEQVEQVEEAIGPLLKVLNYPLSVHQSSLPAWKRVQVTELKEAMEEIRRQKWMEKLGLKHQPPVN
jgi:aryl sulfotransferase